MNEQVHRVYANQWIFGLLQNKQNCVYIKLKKEYHTQHIASIFCVSQKKNSSSSLQQNY